jgi:uncharacterized phiE125 gp8 family phage protein/SPP1 family predicted phage head-tail adaptor
MSLEQVGAPVALAVSTDEAKQTLRIDADETALDMLIEIWIRGVTAEAEHSSGCVFVNRPMRVTLDGFSAAVRLAAPTFSVERVSYSDTAGAQQVLDPQDFYIDKVSRPGYVVPAAGRTWPSTAAINAVTVDFTAGFGADASATPDCARHIAISVHHATARPDQGVRMTPGELNKRVTLQQRGAGKDSTGSIVQGSGWVNVIGTGDGKVWARVRDITGRQFVAAAATQNGVTTEIRIRRRLGITAKMRVLFGQDIYDIEAVLAPNDRWLDLMCARGVNNG